MKVSVALAAYNGEKYIREQLDSIRCQDRRPDEVVVVDDCSKDGTWDVLTAYREKYPELRLFLYKNESNLGYRKNFQKAVAQCSGDLIFLADQDDIWDPEKIRRMEDIFLRHGEILVLASSFRPVDAEGKALKITIRSGWSNNGLLHKEVAAGALVPIQPAEILFHNFCQGCAMGFRKRMAEAFASIYHGDIPHDWMLNLIGSVTEDGSSGTWFLNEPLFSYRVHEANTLGLGQKDYTEEKWSSAYRLVEGEMALACAGYLAALYAERKRAFPFEKEQQFLEKYLAAMTKKKTGALLLLAADGSYRKLKSVKGMAGDVLYTFKAGREGS